MVTATQRRQVITHLGAAFRVSARRACHLVGLSRSRWHHQPQRSERHRAVRARLRERASVRSRLGCQRLYLLLRREGLLVNHKRVYRLYREERLLVRPRRHRKHPAVSRVPLAAPTQANDGPVFISRALDLWVYRRGIELAFIWPGKPVENAYVESFQSRFRDECLSAHWFETLADARFQIERWRQVYNEVGPRTSLAGHTPAEFAATLTESDPITRPSAYR